MKDAGRIAELEAALRRSELLVEQLQAQLNLCRKKVLAAPVIDLDANAWENIKQAASESKWIPAQYFMGDWVADVCEFLRSGRAAPPAPAGERAAVAYEHWKADMEPYGFSGLDAFQAGAAWQRTQSAGVSEGWRPVPVASLERMLRFIDPAPVRMPNGDTMTFQNPHAAAALREISAEFRAMLAAAPAPAQDVAGLLEWAVDRWHAEVANRPLQNVHRRSLDDTWRQVIRKLGGDAGLLCGPAHDALAAHDKQSGEKKS